MDDRDDLIPSGFSLDDEEPEEEELGEAEGEGQNRTFLIGAIVLAAVFVLGLCLVGAYLLFGDQLTGGGGVQVSDNQLTNEANMTAFAITQTIGFETQSAAQAPVTTPTRPPVQGTPTPTSGVTLTAIGQQTQVAQATPGTGTPAAGGQTGTPGTPRPVSATPSPGQTGTARPTSSIIEVTPLGGGGATPTRIVSGVGTTTPQATGVGGAGPIQPTVQATLPTTGFSSGAGLAGAAFLAVALVAVVIVVRRIRLH